MRRIKKKEITAAVLSVCILVVADPFLEYGLIKASTDDSKQDSQMEAIVPDGIADLLAQLQGSYTEVFESTFNLQTDIVELLPAIEPDQTDEDTQTEADVASEDAGDTDDTSDDAVSDDTVQDDAEEEEDTDDTDDTEEPTLDEVKAAILNELTENGKYVVDWYGVSITVTYDDYLYFCKLIQRETAGQDLQGRIMVANVVLNRVASKSFPNTVVKVINQSGQFSPVASGTIKTAVPDSTTINAVLSVMAGVDYSQGALYFKSTSSKANWSEEKGFHELFTHGGHTFYR